MSGSPRERLCLYGPKNQACLEIGGAKHRLPGESFVEAKKREARWLADDEKHYEQYLDILLNQRFLAAGRIQSGAGRPEVTAFNCYVSGTIADSFVEDENNIMDMAKEAATTMRLGGGIGYDFGTLRPKGAPIKKIKSQAGGPVSFMPIFAGVCSATSSYGNRRGAQMGVLPVWHPDIFEFVHAKCPPATAGAIMDEMRKIKESKEPDEGRFWQLYSALQSTLKLTEFNISVGCTDKFMDAVTNGWTKFETEFPKGTPYGEIDPQTLWDMIMRNTWDWAEPGVLFLDTINNNNNLWYCEKIAATNPCGEQPLPPYGACLLGSFNLTAYITLDRCSNYQFDYEQFIRDIPVVVRAMDNVIDRTTYPLPQQEAEAKAKRRMGLGVTGVANALEAMGHSYGSESFCKQLGNILQFLTTHSYEASINLAIEKGQFPALDRDLYVQSGFCKRALPERLRNAIKKYGIRNSHLTSIAPTGTISFAADNISSSIEPVYSYTQKRLVNTPEGQIEVVIPDYGFSKFGVRGKRTKDVTVDEHLDVLIVASHWVDSAVSKTCNVPPTTKWEDFKNIYIRAWKHGCRGCTTFNSGGMRAGILKDVDDELLGSDASCTIDPVTGRRSCE